MAEIYPLKGSNECSMHKRVICYRLFWTQRMLSVVLVKGTFVSFYLVYFAALYIYIFFTMSFGMELGGGWGK